LGGVSMSLSKVMMFILYLSVKNLLTFRKPAHMIYLPIGNKFIQHRFLL
jgi:hypothetical protein